MTFVSIRLYAFQNRLSIRIARVLPPNPGLNIEGFDGNGKIQTLAIFASYNFKAFTYKSLLNDDIMH